ncbi:helix-turn-helix domain-containing protein [Gilliamella sp. B3562]|uniref:helix-turn-helix domain-containing protein n=2 Tax=unclassified Gilliamella TaxID=2685620 RepID=UPI00226AC334|nr:helix-turn-helix domain-containing protein [Gilliamella sp. B3562]MCX8685650.1 helix-turn-helix domain-containing protein [Gilliamella sp. B2864]
MMENNITLGKILSDLRDNKGLTQKDISAQIHVRTQVISEIENNQLVHAPYVLVKSYIQNYAKIVGLPSEEYQPYLEALAKQYSAKQPFKLESIDNKKSHSKKIIFITLFIFILLLGIGLYYATCQNKNNYVEVSHYISPGASDRVNS